MKLIMGKMSNLLDDLNLSYDGHLVKGSWFSLLVNFVADCSIEILSLSRVKTSMLRFDLGITLVQRIKSP